MRKGEGAQVLVVAGEVSGDIHAANLVSTLQELVPGSWAWGIGGDRLAAAGLECFARTEELSHMGLAEVVRELPRIRRLLDRLATAAAARRPDVAVLVDSPDFNLRLAARLRSVGVPVVLYVSPQLWAWRRSRVRIVRRLAREVLCILPFEVEFYREHGVPARYVGHPLVDDIAREGLFSAVRDPAPGRLALLPGSRSMEVLELLPVMLDAVASLPDSVVSDVVLIEAPGMGSSIDRVVADAGRIDSRIERSRGEGRRRDLVRSSCAWTASGTATLECALLGVPMIVGYRMKPVTYALAKLLVRVPHVGLVNLIAGERLAPELIQREWSVERLVPLTLDLLSEGGRRQRKSLAVVRELLGGPGASRRAAEAVAGYLGE